MDHRSVGRSSGVPSVTPCSVPPISIGCVFRTGMLASVLMSEPGLDDEVLMSNNILSHESIAVRVDEGLEV